MRTVLPALLLLAASAFQVEAADTTLKEYRAAMASNDATRITLMKIFIDGAGVGLLAAVAGESDHPLFCPPAKLTLDTENYVRILDQVIKELVPKATQGKLEEAPIVVLLLQGMKNTFPCPAK